MTKLLYKYLVPVLMFAIFSIVGLVVWAFRDVRYLYLFLSIGLMDGAMRVFAIQNPKYMQFFRLLLQCMVGGFLFVFLSLVIGVNFQFTEVFFDACAGVVTGALIQLVVARLVLPFFVGNAFCSRVCWTGFFFEMTNNKTFAKKPVARIPALAWTYLFVVIALALFVAYVANPATNDPARKMWIIDENIFIICIGFVLSFVWGSRFYCRMLCPFLTISGLLSPLSILKITPVYANNCNGCLACNATCPMLIDVKGYVDKNERVNNRQCISCERCVSSCKQGVLKLTVKQKEVDVNRVHS